MKPVLRLALAAALAWVFSLWLRPEYVLDFAAGLALCGPAR
ncbi:hypothetical protein [uncultured Azohydromonas sp.]|jgi:hypothetical protein|nr:hypothetical protein [uncultured Azohydromonas sp.]